jgi:GT2 family glycosyltransferase
MSSDGAVAVDIVVNNHNYGQYVCDAVDSALAQDHSRVSVIVVDDGSSDDSPELLRRYEDRVTLLFKENGGQPSAVNAGFEKCRGDVVMFLDADDTLAPQAASRAAAAFAADPAAARLQFRITAVDESGHELTRAPGPPASVRAGGDLRLAELTSPFEMPTVPTSANAFRTALLRRIMPIPESRYGAWGADYYLVHLSTLLGPVIFLPETGAHYRVHGTNAFQPSASVLNLQRIRSEIRYQEVTLECLSKLAERLHLDHPRPILSMSNLILRIVSRRLAPEDHPVPGDELPALLAAAVRAAQRRRDLTPIRRFVQVAALASLCISPRSVARRLAELMVFPELRGRRGETGSAGGGEISAPSRGRSV